MEWASVVDNPLFRNLPLKIELNGFGQILMTPASNQHGRTQSKMVVALDRHHKGGEVIVDCSIETSDGVKVADVAWASDSFVARYGYQTPYPEAPEICIEIISPSNSGAEIEHKAGLYLSCGAREIWIVAEDGDLTIFGSAGRLESSEMAPGFSFRPNAETG